MVRRAGTFAVFTIVMIAALALAALPVAAETTLVFNSTVSKFHPFNKGIFIPWKAAVEKATQGRVSVEFPAASLAPERDQWQMVTSGIADVAIVNDGFERQRLTLPAIADLPFLTPSAEKASIALWRTYEKFFAKADEYKGVKLLALFVHSDSQILAKKPITKLEDFRGMKLRVSSGLQTELAKHLGAVPIVSDGPQIFEFASKGIVDGLLLNFGAAKTFGIIKYLKTATVVPGGLGNVTWSVVISDSAWNRLSPADRDAILRVSGEALSASGGKAWDDDARAGRKAWDDNGNAVLTASPAFDAQLRQALGFAESEWLANAAKRGVDGKAALAFYQSQL